MGRPRILILDDSASALDMATDARLRRAIANLDYKPTTFVISQRCASVMGADLILVLDDGRLVGKGTHGELMEECAVYREIWESQFGGEGELAGEARFIRNPSAPACDGPTSSTRS